MRSLFESRAPTLGELRVFALLSLAFAALTIALLPSASVPGPASGRVALVYAGGILVADLVTAVLLGLQFFASGRGAFLILACGYLYGALMAAVHLGVFPGALFAAPLFGSEQTVAWLFLAWRLGVAGTYLATVLVAARAGSAAVAPTRRAAAVSKAVVVTVSATLLIVALGSQLHVQGIQGHRFSDTATVVQWSCVLVYASAFAMIWVRRAFSDVLYLWLSLALVAGIADLTLSNLGGARFSLGWHVSRASFVVSACLLLAFLLSEVAREYPRSGRTVAAAYGGAVAATLAAIFLRWFLNPWLQDAVPFITLYGAVAISVWLGGLGPAILATTLGYALIHFMYVDSLAERTGDVIQFVLFTVSCALIIGLGETMRRARDRYRSSEAEVRERAAQLHRSNTNKSHFLAMLSHELRNPLAPLRTGVAILKIKPDAGTGAQTLAMMERQIVYLTRLIDDLLDVSRIDRGKLELRAERVAIDAIVRAAIETAQPGIEARSHELVVRYAAQPLYVDGDAVRLSQVVANLLANAAKFTPPGGRIDLSIRSENGRVVLVVADTGIGLSAEHLDSIFEMFVQVNEASADATGGLGLGLTLVRSIVDGHGGEVEARSRGVGQGAEFIVRLPLAAPPASAAPARAASDQLPLYRRVLVVDDNADAAQTLAQLLRMKGHRVDVALDGASALRAAQASCPDIAFIDLDLPGMSGVELARRLLATECGRSVRLVALTGMGQEADIARTREARFHAHLTKPADPEVVAKLVIDVRATLAPLRSAASAQTQSADARQRKPTND